jgi:hypothetical protein
MLGLTELGERVGDDAIVGFSDGTAEGATVGVDGIAVGVRVVI